MTGSAPRLPALDPESAALRAAQLAAAADPVRLRVLSAIAAARGGGVSFEDAVGMLDVGADAVATAVDALLDVELLGYGDQGLHLTADAWMRLGRLLGADSDAPSTAPDATRPGSVPATVERIVRDLAFRFAGVFAPETVLRFVVDSHAALAARAGASPQLPTLTARFALERLGALAAARGLRSRATPEVLYVCAHNAGRSQLASAITRHLAGDRLGVRTAGTAPSGIVHPSVVQVLDEIGIAVVAEFPKPLTDEVVQAADFVITLGCGDACPVYPGRRYLDWKLDDPARLALGDVRRVRDQVYARVEGLLGEIGISAA